MTNLVKVKKLNPAAKLPHRAHEGDSGADLFALEAVTIAPRSLSKVGTGIAVALPEGHSGIVWGKSSIESQGIKVMAGLVDAPYRGEVIVCLFNLTDTPFKIDKGQKIAQLVVLPTVYPSFVEAELDETTRGTGGFGSTGRQ